MESVCVCVWRVCMAGVCVSMCECCVCISVQCTGLKTWVMQTFLNCVLLNQDKYCHYASNNGHEIMHK